MADGSFSPPARALIRARAGGWCELCGLPVHRNAVFHHRKPRRMGGTSDVDLGKAANGMFLHNSCHLRIESNRNESLRKGWLVHDNWHPTAVPMYYRGKWVFLTDEGAAVTVDLPRDHVTQQST